MSLVVMAIQSDYGSARRMDQWIHRFFSPRAPVAKKVIHPAMDASGVKRRPEAVKFFFFFLKKKKSATYVTRQSAISGFRMSQHFFVYSARVTVCLLDAADAKGKEISLT